MAAGVGLCRWHSWAIIAYSPHVREGVKERTSCTRASLGSCEVGDRGGSG